MTDEEIIKECLREIPVGYIPNHTKENLPMMVREYVQRCERYENLLEKFSDIVEEYEDD